MINLFGDKVSDKTPPKAPNRENWLKGTKHGNPCVKLFGYGPKGATCKSCQHFFKTEAGFNDKSYRKCQLRGDSNSASTDHLAKWPACVKYISQEKKPMVKPSIQDIATYFKERGSTTALAMAFFDRYEANEWTVHDHPAEHNQWRSSRKPMTDWKRAAKTFITRQQNSHSLQIKKRF